MSVARSIRVVLLAGVGLFLALGADGCGGGGSSTPVIPASPPPPGFAGTIRCQGFDLGRLVEHSPNETRAQSHRLPPMAADARLEVTGTLDASGDPVDAFRIDVLADQALRLTLDWTQPGGAAGARVQAYESGAATALADSGPGGAPRTLVFAAAAGTVYDVVLTATGDRAAYVLEIQASDPGTSLAAPAGVGGAGPVAATEVAPSPEPAACAGTHVLVGLKPGRLADAVARRHGLALGDRLGGGAIRLRFPEPIRERRLARVRAWCERLARDEDVAFAEPDWIVQPQGATNDTELARQWNLRAIQALAAWDVTMGDPSVVVGVVDTGIVEHPDLVGQIAPGGYDFISDPSIAGDGNGRDPVPTDTGAREYPGGRSEWHGTHVAGIIAGHADDAYGIAGIAPHCRVLPLRAIGRTGGYVSDVADAILYGAGLLTTADGRRLSKPVAVVNLSFGLTTDSQVLRTACERASNAGVLLVGATGNDGRAVLYPAAYASVVAVGAVDGSLRTLGYSNFGSEVDLSAPGGDLTLDDHLDGWPDGVLSCLLDDTVHPAVPSHGYLEGTSQAAPHVSAVAALLLSVDPTLTPAQVKTLLFGSARDRGDPGKDVAYGWGVVQAHAALRLLLDDAGTPLTDPPALWLPCASVPFLGFDSLEVVPVDNGGGGRLLLGDPLVETDDGGLWLHADQAPDLTGGGPSNVVSIAVSVDRAGLAPGCHGGTVRLRDPSGTVLRDLRVVVYVQKRSYAGQQIRLHTIDAGTGIPGVVGVASASFGYRYWLPVVTSGSWKIQAGQDLDGNGFFCQTGDACGWYGGTSEADATVVDARPRDPIAGLDVVPRFP